MSSLPPEWRAFKSKSQGGRTYYYNSRTGEKTWELAEVLAGAADIEKESLEILELERQLAEKKKARDQKEKARESINFKESRIKNNKEQIKKASVEMKRSRDDIDRRKRRAAETQDESAESSQSAKKKKIGGLEKDSDKGTNKEGDVSYHGKDRKRSKMKEKTETVIPKSQGEIKPEKERIANHVTNISRIKNSPKRKEKKSSDLKADKNDSDRSQDNFQLHINLSSDNSLVGVGDESESEDDNKSRNAEISLSEPVAGVTGEVRYHHEYEPPPPGMLPQEFIEQNLLTQCGQNRNYDRDERRGYASNRNQASQQPAPPRPKMASLEVGRLPGDHTSLGPPLASSQTVWGAEVGDRTPERPGLDDTPPVWGSLEDSEEWDNPPPSLGANSRIGTETCLQHTKNNLEKEQETPKSDTVELSVNKSVDKSSDRDLNLSLEVERPPTPPLVAALQEEEGMEWESVDREEILRETNKARQLCRDIQVDDFMEEEQAEGEQQQEGRETGRDLVVVDTNVFISSLDVVAQLRDDTPVRVVVPWMVVRELDSLKAGAGGTAVRARAAVRWLHAALKADPARQSITAQTAAECGRATTILQQQQQELSPDDRILATCLALPGYNSFLLTNDINLANKALIHGVKCGDTEEIIHLINGNCLEQEVRGAGGPEEERICAELTMEARSVATELLGECVRKEFELAYGNLWHKIVSIKPKDTRPYWSLDNIFTLFSKHHIAVFGLSFPRNGRDLKLQMQSLKEKLGVKSKLKFRHVKLVISDMKNLFEMFKGKEHYETDIVEICVDKLANISSQLDNHESIARKENISKMSGTRSSDEDRYEEITELFNEVWGIIGAFAKGFCVALSVQQTCVPADIQPNITFKTAEDAAQSLSGFFSLVSGLQEAMVPAVTAGCGDKEINRFYQLVTGFRTGLQLDQSFWPPAAAATFTGHHLHSFLAHPENQALVQCGLEQLSGIRQSLIQCITHTSL